MDDFFEEFSKSMKQSELEKPIMSLDEFDMLVAEAKALLKIDLTTIMKAAYQCPDFYIKLETTEPKKVKITLSDAWLHEKWIDFELDYDKGSKNYRVPFAYFLKNEQGK